MARPDQARAPRRDAGRGGTGAVAGQKRRHEDAGPVGNRYGKEKASEPAAVVVDEEESFPRGGASDLTPLERRQVEEDAREEVDRELAEGKQPLAKKPRKGKKVWAGSLPTAWPPKRSGPMHDAPGLPCGSAVQAGAWRMAHDHASLTLGRRALGAACSRCGPQSHAAAACNVV